MIPDVCPADVLAGDRSTNFSLVAGDFEEIYGPKNWESARSAETEGDEGESPSQRGRWGAVVTCFFIDCVSISSQTQSRWLTPPGQARNILSFLRIIYNILEDDGVWINIGTFSGLAVFIYADGVGKDRCYGTSRTARQSQGQEKAR